MLKLEQVKKEYNESLFEGVSFLLGNKEKIGLVGLNGCGKTTLLRIIIGEEAPDDGKIEVVNEKIGYLPQLLDFGEMSLVGEFLESLIGDPCRELYKVHKILAKLDYDPDFYQEISTLSEGQKMKLYLTKILISEPTILLMDEPTNHLDIDGILWLEDFVQNFDGICLMISHDRAFLNSTVGKIFEIDEKKLLIFEGNYDDYIGHKEGYIAEREKEFRAQERKREQLEQLIKKSRKIGAGKARGKAVRAAKTRLRREVEEKEVSKYKAEAIKGLSFSGDIHGGKLVLRAEELGFFYTGREDLLKNTSLEIRGPQKVWFYGKNGIGKTTLVKLFTGELKPKSGSVEWGENISWTYFSQDQGHLDMEVTVEDFFISETGISFESSFSVLSRFLFPTSLRKYKLCQLSPGQRARLSFAIFSQQEYEFLILDEPTNHLDIRTKEVIEESLREFRGGFLLISHDRYFVESVGVDRAITIENQVLNDSVYS